MTGVQTCALPIYETEVGQLKEGMELELSVGALQDMTTKARLEYIAPKGTESNGAIMFEIKAAIEIPKSIFLRAGYSANAEIILDKRGTVLSIPESSLFFSGDSTYVFKLTGSGEEQTFEKLPVTVGLSDGINIEVLSGIEESAELRGNKIITKK